MTNRTAILDSTKGHRWNEPWDSFCGDGKDQTPADRRPGVVCRVKAERVPDGSGTGRHDPSVIRMRGSVDFRAEDEAGKSTGSGRALARILDYLQANPGYHETHAVALACDCTPNRVGQVLNMSNKARRRQLRNERNKRSRKIVWWHTDHDALALAQLEHVTTL